MFLLVIGYSGYYLCRSSYSVAKPLLLDEFPSIDKARLGLIASVGTLLYAIGKLIHGPLADRLGGKGMFLYGMLGAIGFSILFGLGGPPLFMLAWSANRFTQSAGWGGMVRIVSNWTSPMRYGAVMGFVSLSYLLGDFLSRLLLGQWVRMGAGWQDLFLWSAACLGVIFVGVGIALRERGPSMELFEVPPQPNLMRAEFWLVCALSFVFTLLRETFNEWTPTYLSEFAGMSAADAGQASSIFPLLGGVSVLVVGILSDRVARIADPTARLRTIPVGLAIAGLLLVVLGSVPDLPTVAILSLIGGVAFVLIGPYSLLAGATSLDFGAGMKPATAAGWIDGIGYFGGILSGYGVAQLVQQWGWSTAMLALAGLCLVSAITLAISVRTRRSSMVELR